MVRDSPEGKESPPYFFEEFNPTQPSRKMQSTKWPQDLSRWAFSRAIQYRRRSLFLSKRNNYRKLQGKLLRLNLTLMDCWNSSWILKQLNSSFPFQFKLKLCTKNTKTMLVTKLIIQIFIYGNEQKWNKSFFLVFCFALSGEREPANFRPIRNAWGARKKYSLMHFLHRNRCINSGICQLDKISWTICWGLIFDWVSYHMSPSLSKC